MDAVSPHLELTRFMNKSRLSKRVSSSAGLEGEAEYEVQGNVIIHPSAKVGRGSIIGPDVVIGADCEVQEGVRLKSSTLLPGARVQSHTLISGSLIGWTSQIGKWCQVQARASRDLSHAPTPMPPPHTTHHQIPIARCVVRCRTRFLASRSRCSTVFWYAGRPCCQTRSSRPTSARHRL